MIKNLVKNLFNSVDSLRDLVTTRKTWTYSGQLINSNSGNPTGYGFASIELMANGFYHITFGAKIDVAGSSSSDYSTGIDASIFTSLVGKTIRPTNSLQGQILIFNSSGALKNSMQGYSFRTYSNTDGTRWIFGRKYAQSGSNNGAWGTNDYKVGDYIYGECYGI